MERVVIDPSFGLLLGPPAEGGGGGMVLLLNLALIFLIFYWFLIRPQRQERQRHQEMIDALRKGDEVVMAGGIVGTIVHAAPDRLTLKTGENTRIVVERDKVGRKLTDGAETK
jgi:preprotein translocase subunit YajC